jgi:hypothetical protein
MTILDDIRSNSITTLHLSDVPKTYFAKSHELVAALKENSSLEVVIFDKDFLACVYGRDRGSILDSVAVLPNLQEVVLADTGLLASVISDFVKLVKGLKSFAMERLVLQGIQSDFDDLEMALLQTTGLEQFRLNECVAANEGIDMAKIIKAGTKINVSGMTNSPSAQMKKLAIAA